MAEGPGHHAETLSRTVRTHQGTDPRPANSTPYALLPSRITLPGNKPFRWGFEPYNPRMKKEVITYTDDVTGEEAEDITTHTILIDGAGVEIDLAGASHDRLLEILHPYLSAKGARRVRGGVAATSKRRGAATTGSTDLALIRAWGRKNGYEVSDRGRVSAEVKEAYEKAHA